MRFDVTKVFDHSPEGYHALAFVLYGVSLLIAASSLADVSFTVLLIGSVAVIVLAGSRRNETQGTIYGGHFSNLLKVMLVNLGLGLLLFLLTVLTLGFGLIITWPAGLILLAWTAYRLIKGMLRLKDGQGY